MTNSTVLGELFAAKMPYTPPFSDEEQRTIEDALREGLRRGLLRNPTLLQPPLNEVKITVALEEELSSMMEDSSQPVPGFSSDVFETIVRGGELSDYKRELLEKRPDLVLRRKKRPRAGMDYRYFGLFIECKVIDAGRVMSKYVQQGLARFLDGTYAWAVPVALMVAYVDGDYALPHTLSTYLNNRTHDNGQPLMNTMSLRGEANLPEIYSTTHERPFSYRNGDVPGPVRIDHLWQRIL
jgi:hypothetical protein